MTMPAAYFDDLYRRSSDPWRFRSRWYEKRKRALLLACLPRDRFDVAFEPGCANGELTAELAVRCRTVLATDSAARAVELARQRVAALANVTVRQASIPDDWPGCALDLIVLSEVAYYLDRDALADLVRRVQSSVGSDGIVVACHWRHRVADYPLGGDAVHHLLGTWLRMHRLCNHEEPDFLLDIWAVSAQSVASREGLA